ncbi:MAG: tRNA adenosine(34) deaminase TadA [Chloroflexota bacterium]
MTHADYMRLAIGEGELAPAHGDVPIGAVVVAESGQVIGRGHNRREQLADPTAHAEVLAIRQAAEAAGTWRLDGATLYVTVEPCPMCAGALVMARIARLVYGVRDVKAGACGTLFNIVRDERLNHRVEVIEGILEDECREQLNRFFSGLRE